MFSPEQKPRGVALVQLIRVARPASQDMPREKQHRDQDSSLPARSYHPAELVATHAAQQPKTAQFTQLPRDVIGQNGQLCK